MKKQFSTEKLLDQREKIYWSYQAASSKQKSYIKQKNLENVRKQVGLLRANWLSECGDTLTFTFGSAFLVTKNIIITCTHNIYSPFRRRFADEVFFLPNHEKGMVGDQSSSIRKSIQLSNQKFSYFQNFFAGKSLERQEIKERLRLQYQPKMEQITLIALSNINLNQEEDMQGIAIGNLRKIDLHSQARLKVIGFPSSNYKTTVNMKMAEVSRDELDGNFRSIDCYCYEAKDQQSQGQIYFQIINYTMKTSQGMSGSPILALNEDGQYYAIGIHTHKGRSEGYNSGVYFDSQFLMAVREFQYRIKRKLQRHGYEQGISVKQESIKIIDLSQAGFPSIQQQPSDESQKSLGPGSADSDYSQQSQMDNLYTSDSQSEMSDMGLLQHFTIITSLNIVSSKEEEEEEEGESKKLSQQSHCRTVQERGLIIAHLHLLSSQLLN